MNFKRFNGSTWETVRHKIYGSGTDSLTAFPAMIQASGEPLTDYTIYGNTVQNGTPTPEAPVDVVGCGDQTANLADASTVTNELLTEDGQINSNSNYRLTPFFENSSGLCISIEALKPNAGQIRVGFYDQNQNFVERRMYIRNVLPIVIAPSDAAYIRVNWAVDSYATETIMLNSGSTALPYEPYGYKILISSAGQTTPIYLGEVETERKIGKYVFTGRETWSLNDATGVLYTFAISNFLATNGITCMCSHYLAQNNVSGVAEVQNKHVCFRLSAYNQFYLKDTDFDSTDALKTYLAAQYAAGTPVTVWYVLAEPETAIVNEPLMKIGDYADTISFAQAGVAIPTSDGDNTISFGTTVQPSAMSATFKGWHPVQGAKVYDGNDWS